MLKLAVVTPVYNEEQVIDSFYRRTRAVLDALSNTDTTLIFVVDKGHDRTLEVLRGIAAGDPRVIVLALSTRFGHQMSLLAGIEKAQHADAVVMMDCDLQHPPELIPQLLANLAFGHDVVYTLRKDTEDAGWLRKQAGNLFYRMLSLLSDTPVNANAADFRLISGRVARILVNEFPERGLFLRGLVPGLGFSQTGIEYMAERRHAGESKYSFSKMLQLAVAGVLSSSTKPLALGIVVGLGFFFVAFLFMLYAIVKFFVVQSLPSGFTTLVVLVVMLSGIQLLVLGIIGAYIGGIFREVKARPRYLVEEEINGKDG
jgi:polyisoprenyl-phosphate glycosyltransferase